MNKDFWDRKGSKCQRALIIYRTNLYSGNSQSVLVWADTRDKNARKKPRFAPAWSPHNIDGLDISWSIVLDGIIRRDTFNSNSAVVTSPHRATDRLVMQVKRIWALGNYDTENTFVVCVDQKGYWRLSDLEKIKPIQYPEMIDNSKTKLRIVHLCLIRGPCFFCLFFLGGGTWHLLCCGRDASQGVLFPKFCFLLQLVLDWFFLTKIDIGVCILYITIKRASVVPATLWMQTREVTNIQATDIDSCVVRNQNATHTKQY